MKSIKHLYQQQIRRAQDGFTLVEFLVVMGLLSIFMVVITDVAVATVDVQKESATTSSVTQDGRYILARMSYDIQRSSSVTTPASLGASGGSLALVIGGVTYTYSVTGGNLQISSVSGTNNLNGSEVTISGLSVQRLGNSGGKDTIRLSVTVTSKAQDDQGVHSQTLTTTVGRR